MQGSLTFPYIFLFKFFKVALYDVYYIPVLHVNSSLNIHEKLSPLIVLPSFINGHITHF